MLHVFHIDAGRMLTFDIGYAAETVSCLQDALAQSVHAPVNEQVLLISGGEVLDNPERKVSRYSGGTDSNPIFLVCRPSSDVFGSSNSDAALSSPSPDLMNTSELENQVHQASQSPPSFQTIQLCVHLARRLVQSAETNVERCAQLVYDQHLLHQGWLAVIANLDDTVAAFRQRLLKFREKIERFSAQRQRAVDLLTAFENDAQLLKKIPLLPCLLPIGDASRSQSSVSNVSLFDWISSKEPEHSLQGLAVDARLALDRLLEPRILENLTTLEGATLDRAQDLSMKEIGGLGKRLSRLDEYLQHVKKLQSEQGQYSESLRAQEQRAATVNDASIVGDLCLNHLAALRKMLERQKQVADITRRFYEAKAELLNNIHIRLRWVKDTHQLIQTGDSKVMLNGERLHRLRRQLELLEQLHKAPFVYASAVTEVVRRKAFCREFVDLADRLTDKSRQLYTDENRLRTIFAEKFDRHFLRTLFSGLEDRMPEFLQEAPESFDSGLPAIEVDHIRQLRLAVPELQHLLSVQKPNVYERISIAAPWSDEKMKQSSSLRREASFFSQTPPKYAAGAAGIAVSGSAPVVIRSRIASCQSPSWFAGDEMEFFPSGPGTGAGDGLFQTGQPAAIQSTKSDEVDDARQQIVSDSDSETMATNQERVNPPLIGSNGAARSAPIRIPTSNWSSDNATLTSATIMTGSKGHFSEKDGSSGNFGTPEEHLFETAMHGASRESDDDRQGRKKSNVSKTTTLATIASIEALGNAHQVDSSMSADLAEKTAQLAAALEKEQALRRQLNDKEVELENYRTLLGGKVLPELIEMRRFFEEVKLNVEELSSGNSNSTAEAIDVLGRTARKLEANLQLDLEEARKAEDEMRKLDMNSTLERLSLELEEERRQARDYQKQFENTEAFLKQKDDVIELLEQRLHEQEAVHTKQLEEGKADVMKRLIIEQELTVDGLRAEFEREVEIKDAENQQLKQELIEKQQVLKEMRREQDRLVASICDRTALCDFGGPSSLGGAPEQRTEEFEERLRQMKTELEREYKDKLQMLTAGLEARHAQQLERVRKEKEIEVRTLRQQLEQSGRFGEKSFMEDGADIGEVASTVFDAWQSSETMADAVLNPAVSASTSALFRSVNEPEKEVDDNAEQDHEEIEEHPSGPKTKSDSESSNTPSPEQMLNSKQLVPTRSKAVQTSRENMKISVLRIAKGDLVLLVFDPQFNTFVVFTVTPTLYILKGSCSQRVDCFQVGDGPTAGQASGAATSETTFPKQRWILGRVIGLDYCEIKKPSNRYSLPLNTRFFRVTAEPVTLKSHT